MKGEWQMDKKNDKTFIKEMKSFLRHSWPMLVVVSIIVTAVTFRFLYSNTEAVALPDMDLRSVTQGNNSFLPAGVSVELMDRDFQRRVLGMVEVFEANNPYEVFSYTPQLRYFGQSGTHKAYFYGVWVHHGPRDATGVIE